MQTTEPASFELSCPLYRFHLHFSLGSSFVPWAVCVIAWETREEQNEGPPFNLPFFPPLLPPSPTLSIPLQPSPLCREVAFHGRLSHRPSVRPRGCRLSEHHRESERASEWRACVPASFLPPSLTQPLCLLSSRADQLASPPLLSFPLTHESPSSSSYPSRRAAFLWKCARHSPSFPG